MSARLRHPLAGAAFVGGRHPFLTGAGFGWLTPTGAEPYASSQEPAVERVAFPIPVFCQRNSLSEPTYYEMRAQGRGPKEMRIGTKVLITLAAEAAWQRARENPGGTEAAEIARTAKALRERGRRAAKRSIQSPLHVSRRRAKEVA